jgi:hypothetical protein
MSRAFVYYSLIWLFGLVGARQRFLLWRIFATWQPKKGLANLTKENLGIKKKIRHILREKKELEVARFRQCVTVGSQN